MNKQTKYRPNETKKYWPAKQCYKRRQTTTKDDD